MQNTILINALTAFCLKRAYELGRFPIKNTQMLRANVRAVVRHSPGLTTITLETKQAGWFYSKILSIYYVKESPHQFGLVFSTSGDYSESVVHVDHLPPFVLKLQEMAEYADIYVENIHA